MKKTKPICTLSEDGSFDTECLSSGILCTDCDFLQQEEIDSCDGNCAECEEQEEGRCLPAE